MACRGPGEGVWVYDKGHRAAGPRGGAEFWYPFPARKPFLEAPASFSYTSRETKRPCYGLLQPRMAILGYHLNPLRA